MFQKKYISQRLLDSDPKTRNSVIEELKEELLKNNCTYSDFRKLWKALFYSLWQADKVKLQHELAENIAKILRIFSDNSKMFEWLKSGFNILNKEWNKIDYYRMNKFMYLLNKILKETMGFISENKWNNKLIAEFHKVMEEEVFYDENLSDGLAYHIIEKYIEIIGEFQFNKGKTIENILKIFVNFERTTIKKAFRLKIYEDIFQKICEEKKKGKFEKLDLFHLKSEIFDIAKGKDLAPGNRKSLYEIVTLIENDENYSEPKIKPSKIKTAEKIKKPAEKIKPVENNHKTATNGNGVANGNGEAPKLKRKRTPSPKKLVEDLPNNISSEKKPKKKVKPNSPVTIPHKAEDLHLEDLPLDEVAMQEKHDSEEEFEEEDLEDLESDDLLFDLSYLNKKDLKALKKLYPNLPEYYFKTPGEKKKFFQDLNKKYFEKLGKEKIKANGLKKKVEFNTNMNQTKEFRMTEKVIAVKKAKNSIGLTAKRRVSKQSLY